MTVETQDQDHIHNFLNTFLRKSKSGKWFVIFAGELESDTQLKTCEDCDTVQLEDGTLITFERWSNEH